MGIKEEFEKAFEKKFGSKPDIETDQILLDQYFDWQHASKWAACWIAERIAISVGEQFCSEPNKPYENMLGSEIMHKIRQLAKELSDGK